MKQLAAISVIFSLIFCSCRKEHPLITPVNAHANLILNGSFENSGFPDLSHWYSDQLMTGDSVNHDAPSGGGQWSLHVEPQWFPQEGYREQAIVAGTGTAIYTLSCSMKNFNNWTGTMSLRLRRAGITAIMGQISSNDSVWTNVSLTDTVTLLPTDSLLVHLSAGSTELVYGWSAFDKVVLIRN